MSDTEDKIVNVNNQQNGADFWTNECNRNNGAPHIRAYFTRPHDLKLADGRTLPSYATVAVLVRYDVDGGPKNATYWEASRFVGGSDAFDVAFANDHIRRLTPEV